MTDQVCRDLSLWSAVFLSATCFLLLLRRIPGFPKIDAQNDYFLARFDGALIDGHAWTRVAAQTGSMQSTGHQESAVQKAWMAQLQKLEVGTVDSQTESNIGYSPKLTQGQCE